MRGFETDKGLGHKRKVAAVFGLSHVANVQESVLISVRFSSAFQNKIVPLEIGLKGSSIDLA